MVPKNSKTRFAMLKPNLGIEAQTVFDISDSDNLEESCGIITPWKALVHTKAVAPPSFGPTPEARDMMGCITNVADIFPDHQNANQAHAYNSRYCRRCRFEIWWYLGIRDGKEFEKLTMLDEYWRFSMSDLSKEA